MPFEHEYGDSTPKIKTRKTCEFCKWARGFPAPTALEPAPLPDTWVQRWFGSSSDMLPWLVWATQENRHKNMRQCTRYPRREDMRKSSTCGEFSK